MEQSITIKNLCKSYGQTQILKDISFEAKAGKSSAARKDVTPELATAITTSNKKKNKKRNAGKQHSK